MAIKRYNVIIEVNDETINDFNDNSLSPIELIEQELGWASQSGIDIISIEEIPEKII